MSLLVVGLSHHSAPLTLLERAAMDAGAARRAALDLLDTEHVEEAVVLATCNRLEVYAEVSAFHGGVADVGGLLARRAGIPLTALTDHLYVHFADRAVGHLFGVASGLDSMAVGEAQVLGQVRAALRRAQDDGTVGRGLDPLLQQALRVGKRAHAETALDSAGPSLVEAGLSRAREVLGDLGAARVLVVGAGSMSSLAASTVARAGAAALTVANRTPERARRVAEPLGAAWSGLDAEQLARALAAADVVLTCTGAAGHVLGVPQLAAARAARAAGAAVAPQVLVDLGLPRDVDPAVAGLDGVHLVDLAVLGADLEGTAVGEGVQQARAIVAEEVTAWLASQRAAAVGPTVAALRAHAGEVVQAEVARLRQRLGGALDPRTAAELEHTVHRVVEKLLHRPTVRVKTLAAAENGASYAAALRELFDLDPGEVASVTDVLSSVEGIGPEGPRTAEALRAVERARAAQPPRPGAQRSGRGRR